MYWGPERVNGPSAHIMDMNSTTAPSAAATMPLSQDVKAGTAFWTHGYICVALRDAEPTKDRFGRSMWRIWTAGDGREGWVIFGPDIRMISVDGGGGE